MCELLQAPGAAIVSVVLAELSPQSIVQVYGPPAAPAASVNDDTSVTVVPRVATEPANGDVIVTTGGAAVIATVCVAVGPVTVPRVAVACSVYAVGAV